MKPLLYLWSFLIEQEKINKIKQEERKKKKIKIKQKEKEKEKDKRKRKRKEINKIKERKGREG